MWALYALGLSVLMVAAPAVTPELDAGRPKLLVTVRVQDLGPVDSETLNHALEMARDIWRPYVDVAFARPGDVSRAIAIDELDLVITARTVGQNADSLGAIDFVNGTPSRTIAVSTAAATRLMERSTWLDRPLTTLPPAARKAFVAHALAHGVAHEIGHYLLKSKAHAASGLMRAVITGREVMDQAPAVDRLDPDDVLRLGRRLAEYAMGRNGVRQPA